MSESDYAPDVVEAPSAAAAIPDFLARLAPFTPERFIAAQNMGLRWPIPADHYRKEGGLYQGEASDAIIVLWLCTLPLVSDLNSDWTAQRAHRQPDQAMAAAIAWAAANALGMPVGPTFWAAIDAYEGILIEVTRAYSVSKESTSRPNE